MQITKTIYNLLSFHEGITKLPDFHLNKTLIELSGHIIFTFEDFKCKIFNPELATLFNETTPKGLKVTFIKEPNPEGWQVVVDRKTEEQPFSPIPLMKAYCTGYQAGRAEMEKRYPNPPQVAKDLKVIFEKLLHIPNRWQPITNVEAMAKLGRQVGKYSMILDWAEQYPESLKTVVKQPENKPKGKRLTHAQIALIHAYEGREITKSNCKEIAAKHGWNSPTSGESIRQEFCKWQHPTNRHGNPDAVTSQQLRNKIKLIESIIPMLSKTHMQRAIDEFKMLKSHLLNSYNEEL